MTEFLFNDNRHIQRRKWGSEYVAVVLAVPEDSEESRVKYSARIDRYCVPGRCSSYSFAWRPARKFDEGHVVYCSETNESMADSIRQVQQDLDKPQIVELILLALKTCKSGAHRHELAEDLLGQIAPRSKATRAARRFLDKVRAAHDAARQIRQAARETLKIKVRRLLRGKYKDSFAPCREAARQVKDELNAIGVQEADHLIAVMNMLPDKAQPGVLSR